MMEGGGSELSRKSMQLFLVFIRKVGQYFEGFSIEIMLTGCMLQCLSVLSEVFLARLLSMSSKVYFSTRKFVCLFQSLCFFYTYHVLIHLIDGLTPAQGNFSKQLSRETRLWVYFESLRNRIFRPVRFCEKFSETVSKGDIFRHP